MLYLGMNKTFPDLPHHNIVFARDYHQNTEDIFRGMKLSEDISFYIRNSSITDDQVAPAGKSGIYILVPVPNNSSGIDWTKGDSPLPQSGVGFDCGAHPAGRYSPAYRG